MASTSNILAAPSSSPLSSTKWDVFLSFYGKDTRRSFTASLYFALDQAGFLTFRDDPALEKGQGISLALLDAIKHSKMFVVVLSENYARSSWCLDELVEILNCKKTEYQVVPVFYYVDPSDLRHQKGIFGAALEVHKNRHSVDIVEKWRSALAEIAALSGYHLKKDADENESDTIQEIVDNVARHTPAKLYLEEYLFGVYPAVEEIYQKLRMESNGVHAIGICGMGGIGKTTTAKAFYNKYSNIFDVSCFIENSKQISREGSSPLLLLQQVLIELHRMKDYKVRNAESGIRQLEEILSSRKALIVLDDLDESSHLEFLPRICNLNSVGSRLIITTRDVSLLNQLKGDIPGVDVYLVKKLGQREALKLFSHHAFRETTPPENLKELSVKFVDYVEGLPLALKVLGSSLRSRADVSFWEAQLERVRVNPQIHDILKLSYDGLRYETDKKIFLDIVFFFIGKDKDEAVDIFKSCDFHPDAGVPTLVERCLLTVDENNKFQMHNLIQDMGREQGKCTRHWCHEENAWEALQNREGADKIEVLILDLSTWTKRDFSAKIFERLPNLRLLELVNAGDIKGNFKNVFHELRCIRWPYCPWIRLPSDLSPRKLVCLDMPFSKFKTMWKGSMPLVSLKTINVSYSESLKTTPGFRDSVLVEKLVLRGCKRLVKVHPSIGQLFNLAHLDLGECDRLQVLPEPIGQLTKLGYLDLRDCHSLKRLPETTGQLTKLGYLDLRYCHSLKRLPEPIKQLTNLGSLNVRGCLNLRQLPAQLGDMKGLKMLDASYTWIEQLPDSIVHLKELVILRLQGCGKLRKLPEQFGKMEGLRMFNASFTIIEQLPNSFSQLKELVGLYLCGCKKLRKLPDKLGCMECLETLDASSSSIKRLPDSFGCLINLVNLSLHSCKNLTCLPDSIWKLKLLKVLDLTSCSKIELLPEQLGKMGCLEVLNANSKSIKGLPDSIGLLSRLRVLNLSCEKLEYLPDTVRNLKLEYLYLTFNFNLRRCLPIILNLSSLKKLVLYDVGESLSSTKPFNLSKMANLRQLSLHKCTSLGSSFLELPLNLEQLWVYDYAALEQLPDLSSLKQLRGLYIERCINLKSLSLLPPHLRSLEAHECTSLYNLPDLSMLKKLKSLCFIQCSNMKLISLKESSFEGGEYFRRFSATLPNRKIAEWFSYKSSGCRVSLVIPPFLGDKFFGVALWVVYTCKTAGDISSRMRVVITNKTEGIKKKHHIQMPPTIVGEVRSSVECIGPKVISAKSGDKIRISFQSLLSDYRGKVSGEVKVEKCGVHVLQGTRSRSYFV